jgi:hypothetical protein
VKIGFKLFVATAVLAVPTSVISQMPQGDAGCLLVSNLFARSEPDAKGKQIAQAANLFYGARVSALPATQIRVALLSQRKLITKANAGPAMTACARAMDSSLKNLQNISSSLSSK